MYRSVSWFKQAGQNPDVVVDRADFLLELLDRRELGVVFLLAQEFELRAALRAAVGAEAAVADQVQAPTGERRQRHSAEPADRLLCAGAWNVK